MSEDRVSHTVSTLPEVQSGSPGSILRRCREFHGITLDEASETTKIGISHLKALEGDQIREFANQAYLKGFLRIYATYLGLNSDDIARMYEKLFGGQGEKPHTVPAASSESRKPRRLVLLRKMLFPAFLLALIIITATFFKKPPPPLVRQPPPAVSPIQNVAVQQAVSSVQNRTVQPVIPAPKVEKRPVEVTDSEKTLPLKHLSEAAKGFILKIRVTQNGTLTATVDGSASQEYELTIGDVIEWKAEKKVSLELSNAGGVDVELNGKTYKTLGPAGKSAYVEFDADGVKP